MAQELTPNPFTQNATNSTEGKITFFDDDSKQSTSPGQSQVSQQIAPPEPTKMQTPFATQAAAAQATTVSDDFNALVRNTAQPQPSPSSSQSSTDSPFLVTPVPVQAQTQTQTQGSQQFQVQGTAVETAQLAGFWVRYAAVFLDGLLLFILQIVLQLLIKNSGVESMSVLTSSAGFIIPWMYSIGFLYLWKGETPGKRALGIRVVSSDQRVLSLGRIILREILGKFLSAILLGIGYFMMPFTKRKQALHDKLASTLVIYKDGVPGKRTKYIVFAIVGAIVAIVALIIGGLSSLVYMGLGNAREKAQDAAMRSEISMMSPEAIVYADNHNDSLIGFVPTHISENKCSGAPKINISPDGNQMAIFGKLCSDTKKYFCSELNIQNGQEDAGDVLAKNVDISKDFTCGDTFNVFNATDTSGGEEDSFPTSMLETATGLDAARNKAHDGALRAQLSSVIPDALLYSDEHNSLVGFTQSGVDIVDACSGPIQKNISPDGRKMVIYAKSCTDATRYICADFDMDNTNNMGLFENGGLVSIVDLGADAVSCGQRSAVNNVSVNAPVSDLNIVSDSASLETQQQNSVMFKTMQIASIIQDDRDSNPDSNLNINKPSIQSDIKLILEDRESTDPVLNYTTMSGEKEYVVRVSLPDNSAVYCMDSYRSKQGLEPLKEAFSGGLLISKTDCVHNPLK